MNTNSGVQINEMLVFAVIVLIWAVYRVIRNLTKGKLDLAREALLNLAFVYGCLVIKVTFFPMYIVLYAFDADPANLVPLVRTLQMIQYATPLGVIRNLVGNLVLLMPLGIFLPIFFRSIRRWWKMLVTGFLVSLSIELAQYLLKVRLFDVDDLIFNTLGILAGFLIFILIDKVSFLSGWLAKFSAQAGKGQKRAFLAYSLVTILAFLSIYSYQIAQQTETEAEIIKALPSIQQSYLGTPKFGKYMFVFSQSEQGNKSFAIYRQVFFNRYTLLEWGDLQLAENIYQVSGMSTDNGMNYFVMARSQKKAAAMVSLGEKFPLAGVGDYYFSYARLPLNQPDRYSSFHFLDQQGNDLALSMAK